MNSMIGLETKEEFLERRKIDLQYYLAYLCDQDSFQDDEHLFNFLSPVEQVKSFELPE